MPNQNTQPQKNHSLAISAQIFTISSVRSSPSDNRKATWPSAMTLSDPLPQFPDKLPKDPPPAAVASGSLAGLAPNEPLLLLWADWPDFPENAAIKVKFNISIDAPQL